MPHVPVVIAIAGSVTPPIVAAHARNRHRAERPPATICAVKHTTYRPRPGRRGSVAFPLQRPATGPAESARETQRPEL
jgi:hypothetical protein